MDLGQCFKQPLALPLLSTFHTSSLTSFDVAQNGEIQNTWADYLSSRFYSARWQDGRSVSKNQLYVYKFATNNRKITLRKEFYLLEKWYR